MSATLRHDIGQAIYTLIEAEAPGLMGALGAEEAARWAGIHRAERRYKCRTFALKLPCDLAKAWELLRVTSRLRAMCPHKTALLNSSPNLLTGVAVQGCHVLASKLTVSLGLPHQLEVLVPGEESFIWSIDDRPGEVTTWSAYADWLCESEDRDQYPPQAKQRGETLAAVLAKKAVKVRYGTPKETGTAYQHVQQADLIQAILNKTGPRGSILGAARASG
jgi:uncharacterized protein (TIGR02996 family)